MTTETVPTRAERLRRLSPDAGWLPLVLLLLMAFLTGKAIDDAKWVPGPETLTDFLPWTAMLGVLAGFATSILGWGRFRSAFVGAVAAALIVPWLVGAVLSTEPDIVARYQVAAKAAADATIDLIVEGRGSTVQFGHSLLLFGFLLWGTGQFAAVAVYRYGRAMPAVVALGTYLVIDVTLTTHSQLGYLVAYCLVALLLLVRMHAVDERREWLRRRIGDPGPLGTLTLRAGTVFVTVAVLGSLALTTAAHSKPLQAVWQDVGVQDTLIDIGRKLQQYVPFVTNPKGPAGVDFGPSAQIGLIWTSDPTTALFIRRDPRDTTPYYWRAATYDTFEGDRWTASDGGETDLAPGAPVLADTTEVPPRAGWKEVSVDITIQDFTGSQAFSPIGPPVKLDIDAKALRDGGGAFVSSVEVGHGMSYTITGLAPITDKADKNALTEATLRAAGTDYSGLGSGGLKRYTQVPFGTVGPESEKIIAAVEAARTTTSPYDTAVAMRDYLADPKNFNYSTDVSSVQCGDRGIVECFATFKQGFCQYYASTMAVLLRDMGIPARFVQGFLPGARSATGDVEEVKNSGSHAWVEVYFPGVGWYLFDPTGGNLNAQAPELDPGGVVVAPPPPSARPSGGTGDDENPPRDLASFPAGQPATSTGVVSGPSAFVAIALLLLIIVGGLAFAAYRRGPREVTPESAWGSVTRVARRLGFGPRPTQTVYEYSAALGEILPTARPALQTVAEAKVEVAYGHRVLSAARIEAVRTATNRLRVQLLRLIVRRPRRRQRR